jgi:hypothetical protein
MQRFKSSDQAQHFLSAHAFIHGHFHPRRHLIAATAYRAIRSKAFNVWKQETCSRLPSFSSYPDLAPIRARVFLARSGDFVDENASCGWKLRNCAIAGG